MTSILENPITDCLWFLGILLVGLVFKRIFSTLLGKSLYQFVQHDNVPVSEFVNLARKPLETLFLLIILFLAFDHLQLPVSWNFVPKNIFGFRMLAFKTYEILFICTLAWLGIRIVLFIGIVFKKRAEATHTCMNEQFVPFFKDLSIIGIVILTVFVVLGRVFEVNVPALITGLGIGGLAIALAARETLENLFASFTIMLDAPFAMKDTVQIGNILGEVEKLGFRSTHIRMKDGGLATIPNRLITSQTIENQTQRPFWRCLFMLHLHTDTSLKMLQKIVKDIQELVEKHPHIYHQEPGYTHFDSITQDALLIQVRYHVATQSSDTFRFYQAEINLEILKIIEKNGAKFAMPSQEIWMEKS